MAEAFNTIVVGAGVAGLCASISSAQAGKKTLLIDRLRSEEWIKSNPVNQFFNSIDPERQGMQGIIDSPDFFYKQTLNHGSFRGQPNLVKLLCYKAYEAQKWLESLGIKFKERVIQLPGGDFARTLAVDDPANLKRLLLASASKLQVAFLEESAMTDFVKEGSLYRVDLLNSAHKKLIVKGENLVLCCGGFSSNSELCSIHDPRTKNLPFLSNSADTGHVLQMARKKGADVVALDQIDHVFGLSRPSFLELELPATNYILVDRNGKQIPSEGPGGAVEALLNQSDQETFLVSTERLLKEGLDSSVFEKIAALALSPGNLIKKVNLSKVPKDCGVNTEGLMDTLACYENSINASRKISLLASSFVGDGTPVWLLSVTAARTATLGGLFINDNAQVLHLRGKPIPGLFAAGEIVGGIHGAKASPGNILSERVIFGRIAGQTQSFRPNI